MFETQRLFRRQTVQRILEERGNETVLRDYIFSCACEAININDIAVFRKTLSGRWQIT